MSARQLMVDADLDAALEADGFVVVPVLAPAEVERLRAVGSALDHRVTTDRSFAAGFHATIIDDRREFRTAAHDAIVDAVADRFDEIFVDLEVVFVNWLHKVPGAAAVPNHIDWTFVDEAQHRSISVWVPLVDTDGETGAIGVAPASHHAVNFIRAAAHPSYEETDAMGAGLPGRRILPLKAGEGVVFDHRLVHFSAPHHGSEERVAITCELIPHEAQLLHFEQLEPGRFLRHEVDPSFFVTYAAGQDPRSQPGHRSTTTVAGRSFTPAPAIPAAPEAPVAPAAAVSAERGDPAPAPEPERRGRRIRWGRRRSRAASASSG